MTGPLRISAEIEGAEAALAVAAMLDEVGGAVAAFETREAEGATPALWRVESYPRAPALDAELEVRLRLAAIGDGGRILQIGEERLAERDWLAENRRAFPPLRIGRFFVHGSHWSGQVPAGAIEIEIDAATAFGTGEHPSTYGCLLALDRLARRRRFQASARYRHRQRRAGDRRREDACSGRCWRAISIARRCGSPGIMSGATVCAAGYSADLRPRLPQPGGAPERL